MRAQTLPHTLPVPWDQAQEIAPAAPLRRLFLATLALCAVLLVLAIAVPIGGAVMAYGEVGVDGRVKRIAHPSGGVIAQIPVINGEHVRKGQVLMRFDDTVSGADATYSRRTLEQLVAQRARLEAERLGQASIDFPSDLLSNTSPGARRAMEEERKLFALRNAETQQMQAQIAARIAQYHDEMRGLDAQLAAVREQRSLIEPERRSIRDLWEKKLVTISRLNQLERTAVDLDGTAGSLQAQISQTRARVLEAQEQSIQIVQKRRADAGDQLAQINTALNQQRLRDVTATDQQDRTAIRAPYSGTVEKIAFSAIGEVVRAAEPIMEIVPDKDRMIVEAAVSPNDIDQIENGQSARVRFTAFNHATTPEISGRVIYVASDLSRNEETGAGYFPVRIQLDSNAIGKAALALRSGMPAEVHIQTGSRPLASFVTKPLRDQLNRAFRAD